MSPPHQPAVPWRAASGWVALVLTLMTAWGGAALDLDGRWLGWPGGAAAVAVVLGIALLTRWADPGTGVRFQGLWVALAALALAPSGRGWDAVSGPPLVALAIGALLWQARRAPPSWCFLPVVLACYVGVALRVQERVGAEGDEPHYLMVAESLWRDGDVALAADYASGRYRSFYRTHPTLEPHFLVRGKQGEIYSQQALGLSLLVLPAQILAGAKATACWMALLAAALAFELRRMLRAFLGPSPEVELLGWVVAFSPPLVHFAGVVLTEIPAALGFVFVLNRLRQPSELTSRGAALAGLVVGLLPWLNVRYLPLSGLLVLYALCGGLRGRRLFALLGPLFACGLASMAYHQWLYGFADPTRVYGQRPGFAWRRLLDNLPALLLDQEFGLLSYAPIFALAVPGLWMLRRSGWRHLLPTAGALLVVLATAATWRMWWGGFAPPGRFLVPVVPALALGLGTVVHRFGWRAPTALLAGFSLFLGCAGALHPELVHRDRDGSAPLWRAYSGALEWTGLLPGYVIPEADPARHQLALLWALALLGAGWVATRRRPEGRWAYAAGVFALLLVTVLASRLSTRTSADRDAVRVVGRSAVALPGLRGTLAARARWTPADLGWGPAFQSHRFPEGAELGRRLPLPAGDYRLDMLGEALPGAQPLILELEHERGVPSQELHRLECGRQQCTGTFAVESGDRAVTLRLRSGGPWLVSEIRLERTFNPQSSFDVEVR